MFTVRAVRTTALALVLTALVTVPLAARDLVVHVRDKNGAVVASLAVPPGGWTETVESGTAPPKPPDPNPTPPPNPPPNPPQPAPAAAKHFILIRDDTPGKMTSAQLAAVANQSLRQAVSQKGLKWWAYDVSQDEVQKTPQQSRTGLGLQAAMTANHVSAPCFLWLDAKGNVVKALPMPQDAAGIAASVGG